MANFNITWNPAQNESSVSQNVEYKKSTDSSWILYSNVGPETNIASITGLLDNVIYNFRISNVCSYGGPTASSTYSNIKITCPTITFTETVDSITYSFNHGGGSLTGFIIELLENDTETILDTQTPTVGATMTGTFNGLDSNTTYKFRLKISAGTFSHTCSIVSHTTEQGICEGPENISAEIIL